MIIRKTMLAAVIAVTAFAAVPAKADVSIGFGFGGTGIYFDDHMSRHDARRILRHRGYHDIDFVERDGWLYKFTAEKHGDDYFIVVSGFTGDIVHRHEI